MKRTRFFYGKKGLLALALAWLLLLDEAVAVNMREKRAQIGAREKATEEWENQAGKEEAFGRDMTEDGKSGAQEQSDSLMEVSCQNIRVLLMDTDYQSYYHPVVTVTFDESTVTYTPDSPELAEGSLLLAPVNDQGIRVDSITRQEGHPIYEGTLEIRKTDQGLTLINELPMESYLEAVVPSEMPASYQPQALMAQAVCARTYACKQMEEGKMKEYGADVDDSVNFQVYRNIAPKEETTNAVKATAGQVLCQNGELIEAYYFSTSAGATSTDEIWGADAAAPYLQAVACSFDGNQPWSRWQTEIPWSTLETRAQSLTGCGGKLSGLEILRKNQSGAVTSLWVITERGSNEINGEYEVRQFFSPQGLCVLDKDGREISGGSLLPSAYFTMDAVPGQSVLLQGGGYGHGVGMSQNGANEMAKEGYSWEEILHYFFREVQIEQII